MTTLIETDNEPIILITLSVTIALFWYKTPTDTAILPGNIVSKKPNFVDMFPKITWDNTRFFYLLSTISPAAQVDVGESYYYVLSYLYQLSYQKLLKCLPDILIISNNLFDVR